MKINPEIFQYEIFRDLLYIILGIAAVMIGLFALMAYKLLKKGIEIHVNKIVTETFLKAQAGTLLDIGYMFWENYDNIKEDVFQLEHAIEITNDAYKKFACKLNEKKRENEELICKIRNNLAFYLSELCRLKKANDKESKMAIDYAKYISKRKSKFHNIADAIIDTCDHVKKYCEEYFKKE